MLHDMTMLITSLTGEDKVIEVPVYIICSSPITFSLLGLNTFFSMLLSHDLMQRNTEGYGPEILYNRCIIVGLVTGGIFRTRPDRPRPHIHF